jgi:hypothetical protein
MGAGQNLQGAAEVGVHHGIEKPDPLDLAQRNRAHPLATEQVQRVHFYVSDGLGFHAYDDAGKQGRLLELERDLDFLAASLIQNFAECWIAGEVESEAVQGLVEGIGAVIADGADLAASEVLQHEALEQIVHVRYGKRQIDAGGVFHFAFALEIADAAAEEDDLGNGQGAG